MNDISDLQGEIAEWTFRNFGKQQPHQPLLGLTEEVGELAHAHLKLEQGIRGTPEEHHKAKFDAVADIFIFLCNYCETNHIDLQEAIRVTWDKVKQRDWQKNKKTGGEQ